MRCSADRLIEALIAVQMIDFQKQLEEKNRQQTHAKPNVVTISRECGSLGKQVAQLLADALEVRCCDRLILQEVARRAHVDEKLVEALDQHVSHIEGHWWHQLLHKDALSYELYYQHLVKTVLSISRTGGVILGRGANLILGKEKAFRVRVTGSLQKCAATIAKRDHIDTDKAMEKARRSNRERAEYIHRLYDTDINNLSHYDLILNSDRFNQIQMVELILTAMETAGYTISKDARKSLASLAE
jgi:cytidylate kinase